MSGGIYKGRDDRSTRAVLKDMTFKEKREHIWAYYKLHIAAAALVIIAAVWSLNHWVFNPPKKAWLNVTLYNVYMEEEGKEALTERLAALIPEDGRAGYEVSLRSFIMYEGGTAYAASQQMAFAAFVTAGDIDILIMDADSYEQEFMGAEFLEKPAALSNEAADICGPYTEGAYAGIISTAGNKEAAEAALRLITD